MSHNTLEASSNKVAVDPLDGLIVRLFGSLAFACVLTGGLMGVLNFGAKTSLDIFGIQMSTTSVAIAFVAIGVFTAYFAVRIVLKSRRELERLRMRNRTALMRAAHSKARRSTAASRDTIHRRRATQNTASSKEPTTLL